MLFLLPKIHYFQHFRHVRNISKMITIPIIQIDYMGNNDTIEAVTQFYLYALLIMTCMGALRQCFSSPQLKTKLVISPKF